MWINKITLTVFVDIFISSNLFNYGQEKYPSISNEKKNIYIRVYIHIYINKYIRNIRSFVSFLQWLDIDHNKRRDSNKSSLSDCSAVNWQHFTVWVPNFTHKYICLCSAVTHSQWSSKPPACHLLLPMNNIKSARHPRELQRIFSLHFRGTELDPWWKVQKKPNTYKPGNHKPETSALHCAYLGCGIYLGVQLLSHRLHCSKPESLPSALVSHHSPSLDPNQSKHCRRLSRIYVLEPDIHTRLFQINTWLSSKIKHLCTGTY